MLHHFVGGLDGFGIHLVGALGHDHVDHFFDYFDIGHFQIILLHAAVTGLIRLADVGLIPHVHSPLTEAMSPLKLYEYLAGGLPVVAADLPPVRGVDPRVALVADGAGYPDAVRAALELGRAGEDERLTFVHTNSWSARHDRLLDLALA